MGQPTKGADNDQMDVMQYLGPAIGSIRTRMNMTQKNVVDAMTGGFGQTDISRVENGKQGLSLQSLNALAAAMGVLPSTIMAEAERLAGVSRQSTGSLLADDPGKAESRIANDIDALRYALGALFTVIATERPAEGEAVARLLRQSPQKFLDKEGSIHALLAALDGAARRAKGRPAARRGAAAESP